MDSEIVLLLGAGIILLWGIAHILPTRAVLAGFGDLTSDNRKILTMEWVAEGLLMIFLGVLTAVLTLATPAGDGTALLVIRIIGGMLLVLAGWTALTGSRTSIAPIRMCPFVKTAAAVLLFAGTVI
jgi:hypothetical protein